MVTRPVLTTALVGYFVLFAVATPSSAQSDYLAPVPVPAGAACGDTAPDCAAICKDSAGACQSRTPIGDYLRCNQHLILPQCALRFGACRFLVCCAELIARALVAYVPASQKPCQLLLVVQQAFQHLHQGCNCHWRMGGGLAP